MNARGVYISDVREQHPDAENTLHSNGCVYGARVAV